MFEVTEIAIVLLIAGVGLFLLIDGWRGRLCGIQPRCRKCGYSLLGRVEGHDRCPECGAWLDLPGSVGFGDRQRRPRRASLGVVMLLLASGWLTARAAVSRGTVDPMKLKPVWWVFNEMKAGTPGVTRELYNRLVARKLSQAQIDQIADWVLAKQADRKGPWMDEWADFIEMAHRCSLIDKARWEQYIRQGYCVEVSIRPAIRAGDVLPIQWHEQPRRLSTAVPSLRSFVLTAKAGELFKNDQDINPMMPSFGTGNGDVTGWFSPTTLATARRGRQKVVIAWEVTAGGLGSPLTKIVRSQELECEVMDRPTAVGADRPELREAIVHSLSAARVLGMPVIELRADNPPMDLAFNVVLEWSGRQFRGGRMVFPKRRNTTWTQSDINFGKVPPASPEKTLRVILRPSAAAAAETMDIREYWGGDPIVIDNVKWDP